MSVSFNKARSRWVFDFNKVVNGQRVRATKMLPAGWSKTEAETFSQQETSRLYGIATGTIKERVRIETAVELYIKHRCPELKTGDNVTRELALIYWLYKDKYMDELPELAMQYKAASEHLQPASIKNRLSYLRSACRYTQKHHRLGAGVALDLVMPTVKNERQVYADRQQMLAIARRCVSREGRAIVRIAFYSGMRLSEIFGLGKENKVGKGVFALPDTKNSTVRHVPIHPRLNVVLKYLPFKLSRRGLQDSVRKAMNRSGFEDMTFHDLRHSSASMMINNDVSLYTVGAVLGHKDQRSTKRYSHLSVNTLAKAIGKIK